MAQRNLNLGTPPAGTNGDTLRQAFEKVQANTTELYATKQDGIEGLTPAGIAFLQAGDAPAQRQVIGLDQVSNTSDLNKPVSTAQQAALDGKVDKVAGKGLSENDFTDELYDKLSGIEGTHFRGQFISLEALRAAIPSANIGDYANIDPGEGQDVQRALWDSDDADWVISGSGGGQMTPAQIKSGLLANPDTNVLTDAQLQKLNGVADGATANQSDSYLLNRANHTGSQWAATISDFSSAVRSTLLTGLAAGTNAAIAATDSVLGALAKLQAQIAAKLTNPMTSPGDLILGATGGAPARLPIGSAGQVLKVNSAGAGLEYAAAGGFSYFESMPLAWVAGGELTVSHNLGVVPKICECEVVFKVAANGFAIGERAKVNVTYAGATSNYGPEARKGTATSINVKIGAQGLFTLNNAGAAAALSATQVDLIVKVLG